jgi:hypothetical protein
MGKRIAKVLDIDGKFRETPDFPVAVVREPHKDEKGTIEGRIVDPIFNGSVTRNLYGRVMTLVEATCETHKLKAVKDLFSKELMDWEGDVYRSARELSDLEEDKLLTTPNNIYIK